MDYEVLASNFDTLQKRINRIKKKLKKQGLSLKFEVIEEIIEELPVIDYVNRNNIPASQFYPTKVGMQAVKIVRYSFEMPILKLGDYEAIAVIEHGQNENMIYALNDEEVPVKYRTIKSICEHCNTNRRRIKTVLLKNEDGELKLVGRTCLKEFLGINDISVLGFFKEVDEIRLTENSLDYETYGNMSRCYFNTNQYLSACISAIKENGYRNSDSENPTKRQGLDLYNKTKETNEATEIMKWFSELEYPNDFMHNIKIQLSQKYCSPNGFIAYSYVAYQKEIKKIEAKELRKSESKSEFVGEVKDKIEFVGEVKGIHYYDTNYGVSAIVIIEDTLKGNEFKWSCSNTDKLNDIEISNVLKVRGTIKNYSEYNDVKQTVLTRCKLIKEV